MRTVLLTLAILLAGVLAEAAPTFRPSTLPARYACVPAGGFGSCTRIVNLHVGEYLPERQNIVGDILYLHGFADSFTNHGPLFRQWTDAGFRVIAFDYPGHGITGARNKVSINHFNFDGLMDLARQVVRRTRPETDRPLLLAGWSTGGLLAVRLVQSGNLSKLGRKPAGMILFAPGIAVKTVVGQPSWRYPLGEVTFGTLTHNTDTRGLLPPSPKSPGSVPLFASSLLYHSKAAQWAKYPAWLPTLVMVAGESSDKYVPSHKLKAWVNRQSANVRGLYCPRARHWLDHELPQYGGEDVLAAAKEFAETVLTGNGPAKNFSGKVCFQFR